MIHYQHIHLEGVKQKSGKENHPGHMFHSFYPTSCLLRQTVYLPFFHSRLKSDNIAAAGLCWVICWYFQIHAVLKLLELNLVLWKWHCGNIYSFAFPLSAIHPDVLFHHVTVVASVACIIDDEQCIWFISCSSQIAGKHQLVWVRKI